MQARSHIHKVNSYCEIVIICTQNTPVHIKLNIFIIVQAISKFHKILMEYLMTAKWLKYHASTKSYLILKFRNMVKFYAHILRPIFSCRVTYCVSYNENFNQNRSPGLILAAKSGPPCQFQFPLQNPTKSKQATSYSWMNALHFSWYLILRS